MPKKPHVGTLTDVQRVKGSKDCLNLHGSIFSYFLITQKEIQLENSIFSSNWNFETVC